MSLAISPVHQSGEAIFLTMNFQLASPIKCFLLDSPLRSLLFSSVGGNRFAGFDSGSFREASLLRLIFLLPLYRVTSVRRKTLPYTGHPLISINMCSPALTVATNPLPPSSISLSLASHKHTTPCRYARTSSQRGLSFPMAPGPTEETAPRPGGPCYCSA